MTGKDADTASITVMQQCMTEQKYVRDSVTRSLIYNQVCSPGWTEIKAHLPYAREESFCILSVGCPVASWPFRGLIPHRMLSWCLMLQVSISGQALVFVVRTSGWSIISRAGLLTYVAFFAAQVTSCSDLIA